MVSRRTIYDWRNESEDFAARWRDAQLDGAEALEDEAVRRAKDGVKRPVYQGGKLVGHVREYSDTLLIFLLKGAMPRKYRDFVAKDEVVLRVETPPSLTVHFVDVRAEPEQAKLLANYNEEQENGETT